MYRLLIETSEKLDICHSRNQGLQPCFISPENPRGEFLWEKQDSMPWASLWENKFGMTILRLLVTSAVWMLFSCGNDDMRSQLEVTVPVSVQEVKSGPIEEYVSTTADAYAIKTVDLLSKADGKYKLATNPQTSKPFKAGEKVNAGQVIIYLQNPEYENDIAIESKKLNLDISKREYEKQQSLFEKGGVTQRELIDAQSTYINAKYAYDNAILQLEKLKIMAPFGGTITSLPYYTPGVLVTAGSSMASIMDYGTLYASVSFPANELNRVKAGQKVRVTQYNFPQDTLYGHVDQVDPALDAKTRSFGATIMIDNPKLLLRPGMFVKLETVVASSDSSIVIPKDVVLSKRRGKTVYIVDKNAAQERVITTGLENEKNVEVLNGINAGDRLVTKGFETLRQNSKVKIIR